MEGVLWIFSTYLQNVNNHKSLKISKFQDATEVILHVSDIFPILPHFSAAVKLVGFETLLVGYKRHLWTNNPRLSSHRYSVIFSADSEIFAFSAMFRAVAADFNFDISGDN